MFSFLFFFIALSIFLCVLFVILCLSRFYVANKIDQDLQHLSITKSTSNISTPSQTLKHLYDALCLEWKKEERYLKDTSSYNILPIESDYENGDISFFQSFNICITRKYLWSHILDHIIMVADIYDGHRILDLGCGNGNFAIYTCLRFPNVTFECVVNSKTLFELAEKNAREAGVADRITFLLEDFDEYDKTCRTDEKFDRIVFLETIGYSKDRYKLLKNCSQYLRDGGKIYIKSPTFINDAIPQGLAVRYMNTWRYDFSTVGYIERELLSLGLNVSSVYVHPFLNFLFMNLSDYVGIYKYFWNNNLEWKDHEYVPSTFHKTFRFAHILAMK